MQAGVNAADNRSPAASSESAERRVVWLLARLAACHVFVYSAAFPFFNNVDEPIHFDLALKYAQGRVPHALEKLSPDAVHYLAIYSSSAYLVNPTSLAGGQFPPPPWTQSLESVRETLLARTAAWQMVTNYESSQPPLYYTLAGGWWRVGETLRLEGGRLLYWLRFLNLLVVATLVWLGYAAARLIFPERRFLRVGVPALLAFMPQTAFYSIQNDVLSPVAFGAAFICLIRWCRTETPELRLSAVTGLALAAAYLTKINNAPLVAVAGGLVLVKIGQRVRAGKPGAPWLGLAALVSGAVVPVAGWLAWCKYHFGDFTGSAAKIEILGWTDKPFGEWWHHPIFTLPGLWTFLTGLLATFWQGEFYWHRAPLAAPGVDFVYAAGTLLLLGVAAVSLWPRLAVVTPPQRHALAFGLGSFVAGVAFLGWLSIIFDFHDCFNPSRAHPYFTSGRLLLGALIPVVLLLVHGLDRALSFTRNDGPRWLALAGIILFMLMAEAAIDWPVFGNEYNWFHM